MRSRQWLFTVLGAGAALTLAALNAQAQSSPLKDAATGDPHVKSIEAINFGPGGLLLIGDGAGKQIVAVDTGDTTTVKWTRGEIANLRDQLAGRLGAAGKDIEIKKMAVNQASQTAYFAVRLLPTKKDLVMTVDGNGKVKEFALDRVKFGAVPLPPDQNLTSVTGVT